MPSLTSNIDLALLFFSPLTTDVGCYLWKARAWVDLWINWEHEKVQVLVYYWEYHANTTASEPQTYQNMSQSNAANKVGCGCALILSILSVSRWKKYECAIPNSVFCCCCFCVRASWGVAGINFSLSVPTLTVKRGAKCEKCQKGSLSYMKSPQHRPWGLITASGEQAEGESTNTSLLQSRDVFNPFTSAVRRFNSEEQTR